MLKNCVVGGVCDLESNALVKQKSEIFQHVYIRRDVNADMLILKSLFCKNATVQGPKS